MFASKKPFTETLVIEMEKDEILSLHGQIVSSDFGITVDTLLSILEAWTAGTDMSRFERPSEPTETEEDRRESTVPCPVHGYEFDLCDGKGCGYLDDEKKSFRNHAEEIDYTLRNHDA